MVKEKDIRRTLFVDVVLPLATRRLYTYRVPVDLKDFIAIGKRVIVQFGKTKIYSGLVYCIHEKPPSSYEAKYIDSVLDDVPIVTNIQLAHWNWLSSYYMCTLGEVMNSAIPSGYKLASETKIRIHPQYDGELMALTDKEYLIVEALELNNILTIKEIIEILDQKTVFPIIKLMIEKEVLWVEEEVVERYRIKTQTVVELSSKCKDEGMLKSYFKELEKAPKQLELLMCLMNMSLHFSEKKKLVSRPKLLAKSNISSSVLNQLVKKGIVELSEVKVDRLMDSNVSVSEKPFELNTPQKVALSEIKALFDSKDVVLLHGITSSGKTEVYTELIKEVLKQGKQVLFLMPEIALTSQMVNRLRARFGNLVGVYHSKFNEGERVEIWQAVSGFISKKANSKFQIVLGARSAVFLPFTNLGLVVVDEEHENSFKQYDPSPRYNGRDAAIFLSHLHGAKAILGTATPSLESYSNALNGKYGLVEINERYGEMQLPEIIVVDAKEERIRKRMKSNFTSVLIDLMGKAIDKKEQVILFQNRRGFSSFLECATCNWIPKCVQCDVTLTYHKFIGKAKCHYCGFMQSVPVKCGACGGIEIQTKGFGTEMIEEDLKEFLPQAKVARMDLDTTRNKNAHSKIISSFEKREVDILVGTQMVTKGLDFDNVSVVGILNADTLLNFPDFRSFERGYQLMAQVGGRAGRKHKKGKVVIQTYDAKHKVIEQVVNNDFVSLFNQEMVQRKKFTYPPFCRLIQITLKHKDRKVLDLSSNGLAETLKHVFGKRLLGPEYPLVSRVRGFYNKQILLKIENSASFSKAKIALRESLDHFSSSKHGKGIRIQIDVDPM